MRILNTYQLYIYGDLKLIIDLNHPFYFKEYKPWTFWRDYYGKSSWEPILTYIRDHLDTLIDTVFDHNTNNDTAFPSDENFVASLSHLAWIELYYNKYNF